MHQTTVQFILIGVWKCESENNVKVVWDDCERSVRGVWEYYEKSVRCENVWGVEYVCECKSSVNSVRGVSVRGV